MLDRMADHRIMDAADESWQADHAVQVDRDHVERRGVVAVGLAELESELVGERRLAGIPRSEQGDVRLRFQRQRDRMSERLHADDLRGIVER